MKLAYKRAWEWSCARRNRFSLFRVCFLSYEGSERFYCQIKQTFCRTTQVDRWLHPAPSRVIVNASTTFKAYRLSPISLFDKPNWHTFQLCLIWTQTVAIDFNDVSKLPIHWRDWKVQFLLLVWIVAQVHSNTDFCGLFVVSCVLNERKSDQLERCCVFLLLLYEMKSFKSADDWTFLRLTIRIPCNVFQERVSGTRVWKMTD